MNSARIKKIRSTSAVVGNWYRVGGTRSKPTFERIVVWAVLATSEPEASEIEYHYPEIIVGLAPSELGTAGCDLYTVIEAAGYAELNENDLLKAKSDPSILPDYLVWEE